MGILSWLFGRRSPAITFTSFSMPVSPAATDTSQSKRERVGPSTPPVAQLAPETPWPTWKNGQPYSESDKEWQDLQQSAMKDAKARDWGLYRNDRLNMAIHLRKEGKTKSALDFLLEVHYLDINGPENSGLGRPPLWSKEDAAEIGIKEWDPSSVCASTAPGIVEWTWKDAVSSGMDLAALREHFLTVATKQHKALRLPVTPEAAWPKLQSALEAYIAARFAHEAAKEAKRLERQAGRDAKRTAREGWKALEREQKKAARLAERKAE
jgi:hypothetical protein